MQIDNFPQLASIQAIEQGFESFGYICSPKIATAVFLAFQLRKPILVEGPPGVGKTELAKTTAMLLDLPLIRLQCYEGLDEAKALYEWKYGKQLLYTQVLKEKLGDLLKGAKGLAESVERLHQFGDIFYSEDFLEPRPLLKAMQQERGAILLIDEIDKSDYEFESLLLEILSDYQISIPEIGTIKARTSPMVFLTSNNTRDISDALKRRCLHLYIPFPSVELEERIVRSRVPDVDAQLRHQLVEFVHSLRQLDLKKSPAISETIDWARSLLLLHAGQLDEELVRSTMNVLLKYEDDIEAADAELRALLQPELTGEQGMQSNLVSFIQVLRTHDVRVSPAETLDAMAVATTLGYSDRSLLRDGLAMTLAKTPDEEAIFLTCFDRYFDQRLADFSRPGSGIDEDPDSMTAPGETPPGAEGQGAGTGEVSALDAAAADNASVAALLESPLMQSLVGNDRNELTVAIGRAAERVGLRQMQLFTQKGQFTRKILDEMGEEQLRGAVIELERLGDPALVELQRYRDILREEVRAHVEREYLLHAEGKTRQFMDEVLSKTRLNNIEHMYLHKVHELVRKMAKKLASRHSRKRRQIKRGQLNMGKTIRRGIANDGVLFNTYWRQVRKEKPQILAVCDVSGSVAAYAKFLLLFLYSLQDVLPKVRSFAFSSHLGEVSAFFDDYPVEKAIDLVNRKYGGATDYGSSLQDFARLALEDINSNTTVIILGDARNNNGDPRLDIMQGIYQRAKQVIWLNPESRRAWGSGDSEMQRYQSACHFSAECNNLKQLERIVDQLLKSTS